MAVLWTDFNSKNDCVNTRLWGQCLLCCIIEWPIWGSVSERESLTLLVDLWHRFYAISNTNVRQKRFWINSSARTVLDWQADKIFSVLLGWLCFPPEVRCKLSSRDSRQSFEQNKTTFPEKVINRISFLLTIISNYLLILECVIHTVYLCCPSDLRSSAIRRRF